MALASDDSALTVEDLLSAKTWARGQLSELRRRERRTPVSATPGFDSAILDARVRVLDRLLVALDMYQPNLAEAEYYRGG